MPVRQSGLCTVITPVRSTAVAPVDHDDRAGPAIVQQGDAAGGQRLTADIDQGLGLPDPAPLPRRQQDPRHRRHHPASLRSPGLL